VKSVWNQIPQAFEKVFTEKHIDVVRPEADFPRHSPSFMTTPESIVRKLQSELIRLIRMPTAGSCSISEISLWYHYNHLALAVLEYL
jgi:hypothetical protein